jgi:D-alanyl-D-alanine endopeptidase (penicillin-binding protein 7)
MALFFAFAGVSDAQALSQAPKQRPTAAQTRQARARAAQRAREAAARRLEQEAMTAKFRVDLLGNLVPEVRAAAAIIYNPQTGDVLWGQNQHDQRPIASLTKVMTAVTFIADDPDLDRQVVVTPADVRAASVTYLRSGDRLTYRDLLHLALIPSDNAAARVLARTSEGGTPAFVERMNEMARSLGLTNTRFADPSGLDAQNVSSAYDISHLMAFAGADETLAPIMRKQTADVRTHRAVITVRSTNKLLGTEGVDVLGGKTGFIRAAGYCLATLLQVPQNGSQVAVVILGANNSVIRFWDVRHLFNWFVGRSAGVVGGFEGEELFQLQ